MTSFCLEYGNISARGFMMLAVYSLKLLIAIPFDLLQRIFYGRKINTTKITKAPIFIIGHYRSGTTYMHTLLAKDERFASLSNYDMICPCSSLLFGAGLKRFLQSVINLFQIKTSMFNNKIPDLDEPAEEDRFLINKAAACTDYWGFLFPSNKDGLQQCSAGLADDRNFNAWKSAYLELLQLITYKHHGKQLVLKSPANTMRIKYLLRIFPDAKFIYLYRNPYDVFYSMRNLWMRSIRKYCLQQVSKEAIAEIVLTHFAAMMEQYEKDKALIPPENLFELQYEQFEKDPFACIKEIYETLGLPSFDAFSESLGKQVCKERAYQKFRHKRDAGTTEAIGMRWEKYIKQWKEHNDRNMKLPGELNVQACDARDDAMKAYRPDQQLPAYSNAIL
ncbi:MAG TPA: sulfotransferase [Panacibacter sp.]|nr:sulfotransferase [Panacibacter sp.]HNP46418.1 sulfotransferase [Panacibacter sp.]